MSDKGNSSIIYKPNTAPSSNQTNIKGNGYKGDGNGKGGK